MDRDRQKAVAQHQRIHAAWNELKQPGSRVRFGVGRFAYAAGKAETALLRVACADLDDPAPRIAYGEVAGLRSVVLGIQRQRMSDGAALTAARGSLWGLYGAELNGGDVDRMASLAKQSIETDFTGSGAGRVLQGEARLAVAADVRFQLAERLTRSGPGPKNPQTPEQLDATLRARDKFYRSDEALPWECQLASCRGFDAGEEAEMLVTEATAAYRFLAHLDNLYGVDDAIRAEQRRDAVLGR